jgi:hypothetical protein
MVSVTHATDEFRALIAENLLQHPWNMNGQPIANKLRTQLTRRPQTAEAPTGQFL